MYRLHSKVRSKFLALFLLLMAILGSTCTHTPVWARGHTSLFLQTGWTRDGWQGLTWCRHGNVASSPPSSPQTVHQKWEGTRADTYSSCAKYNWLAHNVTFGTQLSNEDPNDPARNITESQGLKGTSGDHQVQLLAKASAKPCSQPVGLCPHLACPCPGCWLHEATLFARADSCTQDFLVR